MCRGDYCRNLCKMPLAIMWPRWCTIITFQLAYLVICIFLYNCTSSQYGQIVSFETSQWSQGAIVDVQAVNASVACPTNYQQVRAEFFGTQDVCDHGDGTYHLGACGKYETKFKYGVGRSTLDVYNGNHLCIARSSLTYHDYVLSRG